MAVYRHPGTGGQATAVRPGAWALESRHADDLWLIGVAVFIACFGLVMLASASMSFADRNLGIPLYYLWRQLAAFALGVGAILVVIRIPLDVLERLSSALLFTGLLLLLLVLVPGVGREVNGSVRWISLGPITMQASEPAKLCVIVYLASYLVRHATQLRSEFIGFIKPVLVLTVFAGLLVLEPDYGAAVVLFSTALGMIFLGGVPLARFTAWGLVAVASLATLAVLAPYRMQRMMTFMDPWSDPYNSGFQLTQALIAFGRGEWLGVGLGSSIQKLFYLPEVHTDFLFAVVAEEFGLVGSLVVLAAFTFLVWRMLYIGGIAEAVGKPFAAHLAYGVALLLGIQAFVNIGVNMGVLPTKGLTLPLM
ncbi:MAG: putative lipid II flippase FtsW, partial [Gammaproteobacteria bacterium]|nr:putative lipid II flippase FtsW [Gammaproteobacteria bacterium]